jgi:primosomal protein N' (replication factor Y)
MIARVSLEIALRKEFDYLIPPGLAGQIEVGSRVQVPFGPRKILGCVTALAEESAHVNLKPILKVIGAQTLVTPKVLKLARWIADYYCCAPETALKSVLPEAVRKEESGWRERLFVRALAVSGEFPKLPKRQQEVWNIIEERRELPLQELVELAETTPATVRKLEDRGLVEITPQISERDPYAREHILPSQPLPLNPAQESALKKIVGAMDARESAANILLAEGRQKDQSSCGQNVGGTEIGSTLAELEHGSPFFKKDAPVEKHSGWLPHWRQANKLYFVTFRLNDSVAQNVLDAWKKEREIWLNLHPAPWSSDDRAEYHRRFTQRMEDLLDAGHGSCSLARPEIVQIVEDAFCHFDGTRYQLGDFVIMPNHVHLLVRPAEDEPLEKIIQSWKTFTSKAANKLLSTQGAFWREEYFDHIVRSEAQLEKISAYIRENPAKAKLKEGRFRLGCGSFVFGRKRQNAVGVLSAEGPPKDQSPCRQNVGSTFLLHGVTGSGKTEVYLQALAHALEQGKGAIVLVPEISLTPQTVERFKARFSSGKLQTLVAVLHSHLSAGERHDEWHKIRQGRARIVIGARSAIFAPVEPLGLIIVDEEHEHSYKQEEAPRYHARDVAIMRGRMENAVVVLGSATPSLESYYNCKHGKYTLLELPERVDDQKMPHVRVVDMRQAASRQRGKEGIPIFSPQLKEAITQRLERKEQTILFLNRRGYSTSLQCPKCGYVAQCPNCSLALTFHRQEQKLCCHICGHVAPVPSVCPNEKCKNPAIRFAGTGTQRVEETLAKLFPHARVKRMDADTMKRKDDYRKVLGDFRAGKTDILVGTQMIAKGLHFPNVTLVGIIYADLALHQPDFRAGERTFQLLTQVAGRAGRGDVEGEVFVQAFAPFHPAIQYARRHDFPGFYEQEIEFREQLKYPPVSRVALLTLKGRNEDKVKFSAEHLRKVLESTVRSPQSTVHSPQSSDGPASAKSGCGQKTVDFRDLIIAGPAPAPLLRAETFYRYQIMLRTRAMSKLSQALAKIIETLALPEDVTLMVDIDPVSLG